MTKSEIITKFCELSANVGKQLQHQHAHDCFCEHANLRPDSPYVSFQFEEAVLKFIEDAVNEKIAKEE